MLLFFLRHFVPVLWSKQQIEQTIFPLPTVSLFFGTKIRHPYLLFYSCRIYYCNAKRTIHQHKRKGSAFLELYTVARGDNLTRIARRFRVTVQSLIHFNSLNYPNRLVPGQNLIIPTGFRTYIVKRGDNLTQIARRFGITVQEILKYNPGIPNPNSLQTARILYIPENTEHDRSIDVNGYAFPGTPADVLNNAFPSLTFMAMFNYSVLADGSLVDIDDTAAVNAALARNVSPLMVITNLGTEANSSFNSDLAAAILRDEDVQNVLLDNVISIMEEKGYRGLDIDFEYVYPSDRENYNAFLEKAAGRLHPLGYSHSTAVAPKTSAEQIGLLYEAHDYPVHGQFADHVVIMTYEWGYRAGPPMAVSPLDAMERVLKYAVSVIPSQKILMGMPNYGYDWTLPYAQGNLATVLTLKEALNLALRHNAEIKFDEPSQTPYFNYRDNRQKLHVVWFDDPRSIQAKLTLIDKYNLGGVSYWNINTFFFPNWVVLNSLYGVNRDRSHLTQ